MLVAKCTIDSLVLLLARQSLYTLHCESLWSGCRSLLFHVSHSVQETRRPLKAVRYEKKRRGERERKETTQETNCKNTRKEEKENGMRGGVRQELREREREREWEEEAIEGKIRYKDKETGFARREIRSRRRTRRGIVYNAAPGTHFMPQPKDNLR